MDYVVLSWIYGTWVSIEQKFLRKRETCALHLNAEYHNRVKGNYYCKMKLMIDALIDLGKVVHDKILILNTLQTIAALPHVHRGVF